MELSVGTVVTEVDALLEDLATESAVVMGVSAFRVAAGATALSSVTTTSGAFNSSLCHCPVINLL